LDSIKETPLGPAGGSQAAETNPRQISWSRSQAINRAAGHCILAAVGILFFLPFFWLVSTSLKELDQIFKLPPIWIPHPIRWENYPEALAYFPFLLQLSNTLTITLSSVALTLVSSSLVAYSFSRLRWPGRNAMFFVMLATMMLPYQVTMVPLFIIFRQLGWINTFMPLIVPNMFGVPFFIFLLRQFFLGLPRDLDDAAIIDGCSEWGVYRILSCRFPSLPWPPSPFFNSWAAGTTFSAR